MKKHIIFILFILLSIEFVFSQEKSKVNEIVLIADKTNIKEQDGFIIFSFYDNVIFRHLEKTHDKKYISFNDITNKIISLEDFQSNITINQNKETLVKYYKGKSYVVFIYIKNEGCNIDGILYEVERIIPFDVEID